MSMQFMHPHGVLMSLPGDFLDGHQQQEDTASVPFLTPHGRGGIDPPPLWLVPGAPVFDGHVRRCGYVRSGPSSCLCQRARPLTRMRTPSLKWPGWSWCRRTHTLQSRRQGRWCGGAGDIGGLPVKRVDGGVGRGVYHSAAGRWVHMRMRNTLVAALRASAKRCAVPTADGGQCGGPREGGGQPSLRRARGWSPASTGGRMWHPGSLCLTPLLKRKGSPM